MGSVLVAQRFCGVCGSLHRELDVCPGELPATGAERPGWRVRVETPFGQEAISVLLAPSHDRWRARIVTYPNKLWTVPGSRGTLKFVGDTREEAEAQAIAFVERHVQSKHHLRRAGSTLVPSRAESQAAGPSRALLAVAQRKSRCLPVRFGFDGAVARGMTVNLSAEGMFVGVATPLEGGRSLLLHLDIEGHTLPLRGLVMWNRRRAVPDCPTGMGIRLSDPTPFYQSFVAGLS